MDLPQALEADMNRIKRLEEQYRQNARKVVEA